MSLFWLIHLVGAACSHVSEWDDWYKPSTKRYNVSLSFCTMKHWEVGEVFFYLFSQLPAMACVWYSVRNFLRNCHFCVFVFFVLKLKIMKSLDIYTSFLFLVWTFKLKIYNKFERKGGHKQMGELVKAF